MPKDVDQVRIDDAVRELEDRWQTTVTGNAAMVREHAHVMQIRGLMHSQLATCMLLGNRAVLSALTEVVAAGIRWKGFDDYATSALRGDLQNHLAADRKLVDAVCKLVEVVGRWRLDITTTTPDPEQHADQFLHRIGQQLLRGFCDQGHTGPGWNQINQHIVVAQHMVRSLAHLAIATDGSDDASDEPQEREHLIELAEELLKVKGAIERLMEAAR